MYIDPRIKITVSEDSQTKGWEVTERYGFSWTDPRQLYAEVSTAEDPSEDAHLWA